MALRDRQASVRRGALDSLALHAKSARLALFVEAFRALDGTAPGDDALAQSLVEALRTFAKDNADSHARIEGLVLAAKRSGFLSKPLLLDLDAWTLALAKGLRKNMFVFWASNRRSLRRRPEYHSGWQGARTQSNQEIRRGSATKPGATRAVQKVKLFLRSP